MRCRLPLLLAVLPALALADPAIPDTPAGRAFGAWIDAINHADHQDAFFAHYHAWFAPETMAGWRADVGGYDLLEVYAGDATNVFFRVKQRRRPVEEIGRLEVDAKAPNTLKALGAWRYPAGAKVGPYRLDAAAVAKVIARVAETLERFHEDAAIGKRLAAEIRKRAAHGDYRGIAYGEVLAKQVTKDLRERAHDDHLEMRFSYSVATPESEANQAAEESRRARTANCGFEKAEHLRPNVGYLKFDFFADPDTCAATAQAAMSFLADSDALVFDLRDNRGGRGAMGELLATYLFADRTHLADDFRRADGARTESWTLPAVPGTNAQWAGTGVQPDIKAPAAEALETALKLAAEQAP